MKPASVIIMDEHPIVRMSIEVLLQKNKNITVKLKSGDSHEVLDCIRNHPIDLVILDIELTGTDAFALLKEGANKQVISSQADSLIKISRIWADFFPANTSNQPI